MTSRRSRSADEAARCDARIYGHPTQTDIPIGKTGVKQIRTDHHPARLRQPLMAEI